MEEDVEALAHPILRHRILLDYQAKVEGVTPDDVISGILEEIRPVTDELPQTLQEA